MLDASRVHNLPAQLPTSPDAASLDEWLGPTFAGMFRKPVDVTVSRLQYVLTVEGGVFKAYTSTGQLAKMILLSKVPYLARVYNLSTTPRLVAFRMIVDERGRRLYPVKGHNSNKTSSVRPAVLKPGVEYLVEATILARRSRISRLRYKFPMEFEVRLTKSHTARLEFAGNEHDTVSTISQEVQGSFRVDYVTPYHDYLGRVIKPEMERTSYEDSLAYVQLYKIDPQPEWLFNRLARLYGCVVHGLCDSSLVELGYRVGQLARLSVYETTKRIETTTVPITTDKGTGYIRGSTGYTVYGVYGGREVESMIGQLLLVAAWLGAGRSYTIGFGEVRIR